MDTPERIDERLTNLEIKASYTEDLTEHLNRLIAQQQAQIDLLVREVVQLRQQRADGDAGTFRSLRDDLPPHY